LSIRKRGKKGAGATAWQVGDPAFSRAAVIVSAANKREALLKAKPLIRKHLAAVSAEQQDARRREKAGHRQDRIEKRAEGSKKAEGCRL
jgi:hypothetical protein